jgi:branched-chain amino acid transport system permease protein
MSPAIRNAAFGALLVAALALPFLTGSEFWIKFAFTTLLFAFMGQAWNILGGYGGQFSFGHALFFGTGAYAAAVAQNSFGLNAWFGLPLGAAAGGAVGWAAGYLSFRYGLKGSYFALVTLAFAEVFRILANAVDFTGAGVGLFVKLQPGWADLQPGYIGFYYLVAGLVVASIWLAWRIENSRFGAQLTAIRENEAAAAALGVDPYAVKVRAIALSGAMTGIGGVIYVQFYLYIDPGIAYGPGVSVEILLVPIIGGMGTVFGPLLGSTVLHAASELARRVMGDAPGIHLVFYGVLLVLMVRFMPDGLIGLLRRKATRPAEAPRA